VTNLLRRGGYRSIRQGLRELSDVNQVDGPLNQIVSNRELAYDIKGMLALEGVTGAATATLSQF
jgi:hypothetical protein